MAKNWEIYQINVKTAFCIDLLKEKFMFESQQGLIIRTNKFAKNKKLYTPQNSHSKYGLFFCWLF